MSRELDAKVALQVGYHLFEEQRGEYQLHVFYKTAEPWKRSRDWKVIRGRYRELQLDELELGRLIAETLPHFSTDIATAWGLVEKMVAEGGCPALVFDDNGHWALAGGGWQTVPMGEDPEDVVTTFIIEASRWADSAPEAICKEFLATYEEDDA